MWHLALHDVTSMGHNMEHRMLCVTTHQHATQRDTRCSQDSATTRQTFAYLMHARRTKCPETFVEKLDYSLISSISFMRQERARGGSFRGAKMGIPWSFAKKHENRNTNAEDDPIVDVPGLFLIIGNRSPKKHCIRYAKVCRVVALSCEHRVSRCVACCCVVTHNVRCSILCPIDVTSYSARCHIAA
eukprot:gene25804-biopygen6029